MFVVYLEVWREMGFESGFFFLIIFLFLFLNFENVHSLECLFFQDVYTVGLYSE